MMDANLLRKGADFAELPETYVVFITEHDVIGDGQPLYKVERYISGSNKKFEDGSHIVYVNGAYRDETPVGKLMHDFSCTDPANMHYEMLAERVRFFKESKEGIAIMCKVMEDMRNESLREGMREGMREEKKLTVLRMLEMGKYALEEVAKISGLSLEEVDRASKHYSSNYQCGFDSPFYILAKRKTKGINSGLPGALPAVSEENS